MGEGADFVNIALLLCTDFFIPLLNESFPLYFSSDLEKHMLTSNKKSYGSPLVGGSEFHLTNHKKEAVNTSSYRGKWLLMYFGFCHCPDICPEQLEKMINIVDRVGEYSLDSVVLASFHYLTFYKVHFNFLEPVFNV